MKSRTAPLGCLLSAVVLAWGCADTPGLRSPKGGAATGGSDGGAHDDGEPAGEAAAQNGSTADATLSNDASDAAADEDVGGGDASLGLAASDAGGSADSESTDATNDGGTAPDAAPPADAEGDSGGDPLVLSDYPVGSVASATYPIQIEGPCGQSVPTQSLPNTGTSAAPAFGITNTGGVPVDWTATVTGTAFGLDLTGSTLAPGASVTVHITPLPIPSVPSSPLIGKATVTIHANIGPGFDQTLEVDEYADTCVISGGPTSLNFADVPVGGASTMSVYLNAACHGFQDTGISYAGVYLGSGPGTIPPFVFTSSEIGGQVGDWQVTFAPIDSAGNPLVGAQSTYLGILIGPFFNGTSAPICDPAFANGLFVQGTGVGADGGAADASTE